MIGGSGDPKLVRKTTTDYFSKPQLQLFSSQVKEPAPRLFMSDAKDKEHLKLEDCEQKFEEKAK